LDGGEVCGGREEGNEETRKGKSARESKEICTEEANGEGKTCEEEKEIG